MSHAEAKGIVAGGNVRVAGRTVVRPDLRLRAGDRVEASWDRSRRHRAPPPSASRGPGFRIVHEDDDLVVAEKEAGILTVPAPSSGTASLLDRLEERYARRGFRKREVRAVHRIDRFTSGLVAFSRNARAFAALRAQFASGTPDRVYLAVVEGTPDPPSGRLAHRLVENPKSLKVRALSEEELEEGGGASRPASCRYRTLEALGPATLVEVRLETGRRNQIRVQFAAAGHPLVGDVAYGEPSERIDRTALHAHRLAMDHPTTGKRLRFVSEPPPDFARLLRSLRRENPPVTRRRGPGRR